MTAPAEVYSLGKKIPGKLCFHSCLVCCCVAGDTAYGVIEFPCCFIFMALHAVRELLGIRAIDIKKYYRYSRKEKKKQELLESYKCYHSKLWRYPQTLSPSINSYNLSETKQLCQQPKHFADVTKHFALSKPIEGSKSIKLWSPVVLRYPLSFRA